ncbi:hypothetical protein SFC07_11160 [Corynebacterium callunae]|uniref:hypothetical protein n=1 Tax=Corynebacterium callunae TaxID=1721 RepID=UPI003981D130
MKVTTKPVRHLDADQLQALVDKGWTHITTRYIQEASEIVEIRGDTVDVQVPERAYAIPLSIVAITAVHKPEEVTSI